MRSYYGNTIDIMRQRIGAKNDRFLRQHRSACRWYVPVNTRSIQLFAFCSLFTVLYGVLTGQIESGERVHCQCHSLVRLTFLVGDELCNRAYI